MRSLTSVLYVVRVIETHNFHSTTKFYTCIIFHFTMKHSLCIAFISNERTTSYVFENTKKGTDAFVRLLRNQKMTLPDTLICMEHTDVYGKPIITKLVEKQFNIHRFLYNSAIVLYFQSS